MPLDQPSLVEFYSHVYPVDLIVQWLTYDFSANPRRRTENPSLEANTDDIAEGKYTMTSEAQGSGSHAVSSVNTLSRREFCFTLLGDIFTRFRSYTSAAELKAELVRSFPEKIDVGAVYNIRPSQKQVVSNFTPVERELVFDIDMSDYDNVRSCCSGKSICQYCWSWMSCAAQVLKYLLEEDFGFRYILPVFSGRRGVHLWVCDESARRMTDDERAALVGYLSVIAPKTMRSNVIADLAALRPIHPSIRRVFAACLDDSFRRLFVDSGSENPNNIQHHPKAAAVVFDATMTVLKLARPERRNAFLKEVNYTNGGVLDWDNYRTALSKGYENQLLFAVELLLMYPRLDEHVSTRRDHLLKLPFCVHPGTSSLCCPLEWNTIADFNPLTAPKLDEMLMDRHIDEKWIHPLQELIDNMAKSR